MDSGLRTPSVLCAALLFLALPLLADTTLTNGLAVYLNFDSNVLAQAGTTNSARLYTGGATNGPRYSAGKIGPAVTFQNTHTTGQPTDWALQLGNIEWLYNGSFSFSLWVRTAAMWDGGLFGNKDWASGGNVGWVFSHTYANFLNYTASGASRHDIGAVDVRDGQWHHVAAVFDRSANTVTTYVDGVVTASASLGTTGAESLTPAAIRNTLIGASGNGTYPGAASMDDLAIWQRPLTAAEVSEIYTKGQAGRNLTQDPVPPPPGGLIGKWTFDSPHITGSVVTNQAGAPNGQIIGSVVLASNPQSLALDGAVNYVELAAAMDTSKLPATHLTAEAWVALKSPTTWGGIVGCIQDNGAFERGWLLGYLNSSFAFALSANGSLTYLAAPTAFDLNTWYHVAGTYDGTTMRLYVNGQLTASSTAESGAITYAPAPYVIAAYKDDNEFYPMDGYVREVCVYDKTLTTAELSQNYNLQKDLFPPVVVPPAWTNLGLTLGPYVRFTGADAALVRYETATHQPSIIEFGETTSLGRRVADPVSTTNHAVALTGLKPKTKYYFAVKLADGTNEVASETFDFETDYNYTVAPLTAASPYPDDGPTALLRSVAQGVLDATGLTNGYALDYGCGDGRLALELARRSALNVIGVAESAAAVDQARRRLQAAGLYGRRVTILQAPLNKLPHTKDCFNLIVSSDALLGTNFAGTSAELFRVLRPSGGVALLGLPPGVSGALPNWSSLDAWVRSGVATNAATVLSDPGRMTQITRAPLPGAGEWSHAYGDAGATASSHDTRVRAAGMKVQWFGDPGPRGLADRGNRAPPPLTVNGFFYAQGNNRVFGLDAYNGCILWELEVPNLRRLNIPRDASNMCAGQDSLYLAVGSRCWRLDAYSGQLVQSYPVQAGPNYDWGFVACVSNRVFGSSIKRGSVYTLYDGPPYWYDSTGISDTAKICSDNLFCFAKAGGAPLWTYTNGVIVNSTLALGGGRLYFVDSRNPALAGFATSRITSSGLWTSNNLVALDATTGSVLWQKPVTITSGPYPVVLFLSYANEKLVLNNSTTQFALTCFSATNGTSLWTKSHPWSRDNHGGPMYHTVIAGTNVIVEPFVYDLNSGAVLKSGLTQRGGCSTIGAAEYTAHYCVSYYGASVFFWDLATSQSQNRQVLGMRASCWLSLISGGGLVMMPAASAGCTCGFPLQSSIAFAAP